MQGIAAGTHGSQWFTNAYGFIGQMTADGTMTWYKILDYHEPHAITAAPDGALWFTITYGNMIGRITTAVTPQITDRSPESGPPGTQVTITGSNLGGATKVAFNGIPAPIISDTPTTVVTHVPAGATTGQITITTPTGTATTKHAFATS
jgi:hypothetical protein